MRLLPLVFLAACAKTTSTESPTDLGDADAPAAARVAPEPGPQALLIASGPAAAAVDGLMSDTFGYENIRTVEPSSSTAVLTALAELAGRVTPDSPAVVYVSAPGARVRDASLDEPDPWDEGITLSSGEVLLDDALAAPLAAIEQAADSLAILYDVEVPAEGQAADGESAGDGSGDGAAAWPAPGKAVTVVLDSGGRSSGSLGHLADALERHAPLAATYRELERRLVSDGTLAELTLVASVEGGGKNDLFGISREIEQEEVPQFVLEPELLTVRLDLPGAQADTFESLLAGNSALAPWVAFTRSKKGDRFSVQKNPLSRNGGLIFVGPEGAIRNQFEPDGQEGFEDGILTRIAMHARQHALRTMELPPASDLTVRMVESPDQPDCSRGRWKQAEDGKIQIVPVCHRWQVEVALADTAGSAREIGGVILGNDGTSIGFPLRGGAVSVEPGDTYRFPLQTMGTRGPRGVKSLPPLGIPEHVVVFAGPVGSNVPFRKATSLSTTTTRSVALQGGGWEEVVVPYRIEANPSDDPRQEVKTRELTLSGYDVRPLLPANTNSYLYRLLHNAERLAHIKGGDGLDYAQCLPKDSSAINNRSRYSETLWPNGTCWSKPWDFTRDDQEFLESPGIDCSTTVWWLFTRSCLGDTAARLPERQPNESTGRYLNRVRDFHTTKRKCLLFTEENYRGGYLNTQFMLNDDIMGKHWKRCDQDVLRTGDVLVTKTERGGGGHTYVVIDPDKYVVFGSHIADVDFERLTPEFKELWAEYERDAGDRDTGVEYQFMTMRRDKDGGRFSGFNSEVVKACWRHKVLAAEWEREPTSRPKTGAMEDACREGVCLTSTDGD